MTLMTPLWHVQGYFIQTSDRYPQSLTTPDEQWTAHYMPKWQCPYKYPYEPVVMIHFSLTLDFRLHKTDWPVCHCYVMWVMTMTITANMCMSWKDKGKRWMCTSVFKRTKAASVPQSLAMWSTERGTNCGNSFVTHEFSIWVLIYFNCAVGVYIAELYNNAEEKTASPDVPRMPSCAWALLRVKSSVYPKCHWSPEKLLLEHLIVLLKAKPVQLTREVTRLGIIHYIAFIIWFLWGDWRCGYKDDHTKVELCFRSAPVSVNICFMYL